MSIVPSRHEIANRLIAEATKYVGVREVGGPNKGPDVEMFQRYTDGKAVGESWCFPGSTEVLTSTGWVPFAKLMECPDGPIVAQVSEDGKVSFTDDVVPIVKEYKGKGYRIKTRTLDIVCDEGHRFYGYFNNSKNKKFGTLTDVSHSLKIPSVYAAGAGVPRTDSDLLFLAAFISDGFFAKTRQGKARVRVQVSKDRKLKALNTLPFVSKTLASKVYGPITKKPLTTYGFTLPQWFDGLFTEYKVLSWDFVLGMSQEQCRHFLKAYLLFDGHTKRGAHRVFSSIETLADQLLTIVLMAGYHPSKTVQISKLSGRPNFIVRWSSRKTRLITAKNIKRVTLNEPLYCVSVPEQRILVRPHGGSPMMVGNCMAFMQFVVGQVCTHYGIQNVLYPSELCQSVYNKAPRLYKLSSPVPGAVFIHQSRTSAWRGHTGLCTGTSTAGVFPAIEGNTNGAGSSDGDGVYKKYRFTKGNAFSKMRGFIDVPSMIQDAIEMLHPNV